MKKTGLLLLISYFFVSLFGTNSSIILNAKLDDIPDWVKPNAYLTYKVIATDIDGTRGTVTPRYTVLSITDEITVKITNAGRGKPSEEVMTTPNIHLYFTQPEIEKIKAGSTTLETVGGGNKVFTYVGEEKITTPAGSFLCCKFKVNWDLGTIDEWVEKDTGIPVKSFWDNDVGTTFDSVLQETNVWSSILKRGSLSPITSITTASSDIGVTATFAAGTGLAAHVIASTYEASSLVGGLATGGVASLGAVGVAVPAAVGGLAAGATTEVLKNSYNAGPVETIFGSTIVGTAATLGTITVLGAIGVATAPISVPVIGVAAAASLVFSLFHYYW